MKLVFTLGSIWILITGSTAFGNLSDPYENALKDLPRCLVSSQITLGPGVEQHLDWKPDDIRAYFLTRISKSKLPIFMQTGLTNKELKDEITKLIIKDGSVANLRLKLVVAADGATVLGTSQVIIEEVVASLRKKGTKTVWCNRLWRSKPAATWDETSVS